ncbi:PilZ domain-containing protein [Paenibacillus aestuarii]|uniref:PilZ domain-containing protein n=1 Tax=Paenibacillus aestuarii TaxID=516965 RepID=A0ABW0K4W2_9BACL|nr:PilZ domain-containing protein [Paenibacillus aestuarii]
MIDNKRENFRIHLETPLSVKCRIVGIRNKESTSNYTKTAFKDISLGGARMHSQLDFPEHIDILFEFIFTLFGNEIKIIGTIVRKAELHPSLFEYGIKFSITEASLDQLLSTQLQRLSIRLRDSTIHKDCSFCTEHEVSTLYKGAITK